MREYLNIDTYDRKDPTKNPRSVKYMEELAAKEKRERELAMIRVEAKNQRASGPPPAGALRIPLLCGSIALRL